MSGSRPILILAVDDEELVLDLVVAALEDGGYCVARAFSVEEASSILDEHISELGGVVTDVNLGRRQSSGWEVACHARELNPNIPVIYISGDSEHDWTFRGGPPQRATSEAIPTGRPGGRARGTARNRLNSLTMAAQCAPHLQDGGACLIRTRGHRHIPVWRSWVTARGGAWRCRPTPRSRVCGARTSSTTSCAGAAGPEPSSATTARS